MYHLREAHVVLGMKILRDRLHRKLWLTRTNNLSEIIEKFGMKDCKPVATPQEVGQCFEQNEGIPIKMKEYQAHIGSLTYAAMSTKPDIAKALGVVNQFASNPSEIHWTAAKRILRYLKGTSDYGICFDSKQDSETKLTGFG